jgi:plastocyanin
MYERPDDNSPFFRRSIISMTKAFVQPFQRLTSWTMLLCLLILALTVAACGDGGSPASSSSTSSTQTTSASASDSTPAAAGSVATITITEKTGGDDVYNFAPQTLTIKAGTTIKWVNDSDENHLLASQSSGVFTTSSMVPRSGSNDNTYQMTFTTPGTYSYGSTLVQREHNQPEGATSSAQGTITVTP